MWLNPDTIDFVVSVRVCCDRTFVFVPCVGSMWWQVRRCLQTYTPVSLEVFLCKKKQPRSGALSYYRQSRITASLAGTIHRPIRIHTLPHDGRASGHVPVSHTTSKEPAGKGTVVSPGSIRNESLE